MKIPMFYDRHLLLQLRFQLEAAVDRIVRLERDIEIVTTSETKYKEKCAVLERNLSQLFVTAKQEIKRKDIEIENLR